MPGRPPHIPSREDIDSPYYQRSCALYTLNMKVGSCVCLRSPCLWASPIQSAQASPFEAPPGRARKGKGRVVRRITVQQTHLSTASFCTLVAITARSEKETGL